MLNTDKEKLRKGDLAIIIDKKKKAYPQIRLLPMYLTGKRVCLGGIAIINPHAASNFPGIWSSQCDDYQIPRNIVRNWDISKFTRKIDMFWKLG